MSPRRIVEWEEPTKEEGATMNVVKLKAKNNNTIELNIREGTGSFMCICCSEDSDVIFHRLQAQADLDVVLGPEPFARFAAGELCVCNICLRNRIDYVNARIASNAAACAKRGDPYARVYRSLIGRLCIPSYEEYEAERDCIRAELPKLDGRKVLRNKGRLRDVVEDYMLDEGIRWRADQPGGESVVAALRAAGCLDE
jgi:hypothetical protein